MEELSISPKLGLIDREIQLWIRIIGWLENHKKSDPMFNIHVPLHYNEGPKEKPWCNTVCCIAGAAVCFSQIYDKGWLIDFDYFKFQWSKVKYEAIGLLGLKEKTYTTDQLLNPNISPDNKWAARCIRKFLATCEVDWEGTKP